MFKLGLNDANAGSPRRVLFLGAHCDDIEIGCGGTLLRLAIECPQIEVHWVVLSSNEVREREARRAAAAFGASFENMHVHVERFRNGYFPYVAADIKDYFETLKTIHPDVVFTHYRQDLHQDHRTVSELTWNTFRSHWILEYEIPKYDGDMGSPNVFMPMSRANLERKCKILNESFESQAGKQWFSDELFGAIARLRGIECDAEQGLAEAFYCRKLSF